jgi:WD40 repeat protein
MTGTILAIGSSPSVVRYALPSRIATSIPAPIAEVAANSGNVAAAPAEGDVTNLMTATDRTARAYRISSVGAAQPLGPSLPLPDNSPATVSTNDRTAVVGACTAVWSFAFASGSRWIRVGRGCWAGPSADGRTVLFSPDGKSIVRRELRGGDDHILFRTAELERSMSVSDVPLLVGSPASGPTGTAFAVRAGDQLGVFILDGSGTAIPVLQEPYSNTFRVPRLAWQPSANVLAVADDVGPGGGVLRLFDARTRVLRTVALDPQGYAGMRWSPDGTSIAALTSSSSLVVVDPSGRWLLRVKTDWRGLLGWTA